MSKKLTLPQDGRSNNPQSLHIGPWIRDPGQSEFAYIYDGLNRGVCRVCRHPIQHAGHKYSYYIDPPDIDTRLRETISHLLAQDD